MQDGTMIRTPADGDDRGTIPNVAADDIPCARPVSQRNRLEVPVAVAATATDCWSAHAGALCASPGFRYASFGARAAAAIIDFVILQIASMFLDTFFAGLVLSDLSTTTIVTAMLVPVILGGVLAVVYSVGLESSVWQATPGKMILGLKVVDIDGQRISFAKSSMRNLAKGFSLLTLGVGYLMPLWTSRRQTLHDRAAGCLVIHAA